MIRPGEIVKRLSWIFFLCSSFGSIPSFETMLNPWYVLIKVSFVSLTYIKLFAIKDFPNPADFHLYRFLLKKIKALVTVQELCLRDNAN